MLCCLETMLGLTAMTGGAMRDRIKHGEMRKKLLSMGKVSEEDCKEMASAWDEWIATEDACLGAMHGEVIIRK